MFTGIVEEIGFVKGFTRNSNSADIIIGCKTVLEDTKIGDSIAINGVCQTVVELTSDSFKANVSEETLRVTNFSNIKTGANVNLERALTPSTRMGGHIVQGHVDFTAKYLGDMKFEIPDEQKKYVVKKGSITINGVSLTVAQIEGSVFSIAIIPHTLENTTLKDLKYSDLVNIETDILGKYVENFLSVNDNNSNINENFLKENGFL